MCTELKIGLGTVLRNKSRNLETENKTKQATRSKVNMVKVKVKVLPSRVVHLLETSGKYRRCLRLCSTFRKYKVLQRYEF
jgi:hypothetical protein